jgi:hypothetical protein
MRKTRNLSASVCFLIALSLAVAGCGNPGSNASPGSSQPSIPTPSPAPPSSPDGVSITSPASGASVSSPFNLAAKAATCSSQSVASIGYALDTNSSSKTSGESLAVQVSAGAGSHTVHVTAWGDSGAICTASVAITITPPPSPSATSLVPSNAISVNAIQDLTTWKENHDPATGSTSSGSTYLVASPSRSGQSREFDTSFTGSGGEIYFVTFARDEAAHDFFYDTWVYLTSSASNIANLEMDMNQVIANGDTIIYGFQCDGYSGTWDYTENAGATSSPSDHWVHSNTACNVRTWKQNAWHHIQISYSRDDSGNVTYHSVWLDGTQNPLNATVPSAFSLGWSSVLLTNFQIDSLISGSNTVYLDDLTISRW